MQRWLFSTLLGGAALLLAACGGGGSTGGGSSLTPTASTGSSTTSAPAAPTPTSASASGPANQAAILGAAAWVNPANSLTLYVFAADTAGVSNCTVASGCASTWRPFTPAANAQATGSWTIIKRPEGTLQWAYNGAPLYNFIGDSGAGQSNGNGLTEFGGLWTVARPAGVSAPSPSATSTNPPVTSPY